MLCFFISIAMLKKSSSENLGMGDGDGGEGEASSVMMLLPTFEILRERDRTDLSRD